MDTQKVPSAPNMCKVLSHLVMHFLGLTWAHYLPDYSQTIVLILSILYDLFFSVVPEQILGLGTFHHHFKERLACC